MRAPVATDEREVAVNDVDRFAPTLRLPAANEALLASSAESIALRTFT
jgi:hypothetical protein